MSLIQVEELVSYQLRTSYLSQVADGVGERLITLNDSFFNTAPFKAAGWRANPAHVKRTHSPPIPTAIASEYFQAAPRSGGHTLEDEEGDGATMTGAAGDACGPAITTRRRRERRREQMEEDDSSDLTDESDDEPDQRAAQQIKFAKMPVRNRSGSSPGQASNLRQTTMSSPRAAPGARRGSQSALACVKERARRDTVTSSDVSSENDYYAPVSRKQKGVGEAPSSRAAFNPSPGGKRAESDLLPEEDSDMSDASSVFMASVDSTSMLADVDNVVVGTSPGKQVVGTVPKQLLRQSTIRRPQPPSQPTELKALPLKRPMSTIRPMSTFKPRSLLSEALNAKNTKPAMPFEQFASLSGQGDPEPLYLRVYAPFCKTSSKPFEVLLRRTVREDDGTFRPVTIADLIGLSLWRYTEENLEPAISPAKMSINWWTLRMADGGDVDDDFPPLERKQAVNMFTTANNRARRGAFKTYDDFGLVEATQSEFEENERITPEFKGPDTAAEGGKEEVTPKNTPRAGSYLPVEPRVNPITDTTYRTEGIPADKPAAPVSVSAASRGQQKLLRVHILSSDIAPGQMVTLDVTTETYLAEVLDLVCKKRQLEKSTHVLKLHATGAVVYLDRTVASIGNVTDLELHRRRFGTDGPITLAGSPKSPSSRPIWETTQPLGRKKKDKGLHPLAQATTKLDVVGSGNVSYKKYTVWRRTQLRFVGMSERILAIDGEYVYIQPASGGKATREPGKTTTVHFSNVIGCSLSRKHAAGFKIVVFKSDETKRYDFEAKKAEEAKEIVGEIKKGVAPYNKDI